jgi:hypothetical protein
MLEAARERVGETYSDAVIEANRLSLLRSATGRDPEQSTAFCEVYPPMNFVRAIEQRQPELLGPFRCLSERRAIVETGEQSTFKLIQVDGAADELFDLAVDPLELADMRAARPSLTKALDNRLNQMAAAALRQRDQHTRGKAVDYDNDAQLQQRLRGLGYLD